MAADGTEKVLGGTAYRRYPDPVINGTPNAYGLSPWSAFKARIASVDSGTVISNIRIEGAVVAAILFTTDIPVIVLPICTTETTATTYISSAINTLSSVAAVTTVGGAVPVSTPLQGKPVSGYAGAALDVFVTGFPVEFLVKGAGFEGALSYADLMVVANGPVINGPVGPLDLVAASARAPVPILLDTTNYTPAMRAGGNQFSDNLGNLYQIVGIWAL